MAPPIIDLAEPSIIDLVEARAGSRLRTPSAVASVSSLLAGAGAAFLSNAPPSMDEISA